MDCWEEILGHNSGEALEKDAERTYGCPIIPGIYQDRM